MNILYLRSFVCMIKIIELVSTVLSAITLQCIQIEILNWFFGHAASCIQLPPYDIRLTSSIQGSPPFDFNITYFTFIIIIVSIFLVVYGMLVSSSNIRFEPYNFYVTFFFFRFSHFTFRLVGNGTTLFDYLSILKNRRTKTFNRTFRYKQLSYL